MSVLGGGALTCTQPGETRGGSGCTQDYTGTFAVFSLRVLMGDSFCILWWGGGGGGSVGYGC